MTKITAWNGLQLAAPKSWEAVIKAKKHLLFETDLVPIVEIRWEEREEVDNFYKNLSKKLGFPAAIKRLPLGYEPLRDKYQVYGYHKAGTLTGLFCHCPKCSSLIHIHIHNSLYLKEICALLLGMKCHLANDDHNLWQIQDFRFSLPSEGASPSWQLEKYTFGAGATQVCFVAGKEILRVYRISEAKKNLQHTSLEQILEGFSNKHQGNLQHEPWGKSLTTRPSLWQQILWRLRKERPFYHAQIQHIEQTNRIVGLSLEGVHPIPQDRVDEIWNTYGTFL